MLDELAAAKRKVAGAKQVIKAARNGDLAVAYIAEDAESHIKKEILAALQKNDVRYELAFAMKDIGHACGIEVGSACAGILK